SLSAPLAPVGLAEPQETRELAAALAEFRRGGDPENPAALVDFVNSHPSGAWTPSLRAGLGRLYRDTGHIGRALSELESAWSSLAGETSPELRLIADAALGNLLELDATLGRVDDVRRLLAQAAGRAIAGNAAEQVAGARRGLWMMVNDPGGSFRCGPLAVEQVARAIRPGKDVDPRISAYRSSPHGTTLSEIARLASDSGLDLVPVRRSAGEAIPVPSVVHWKADHFAA